MKDFIKNVISQYDVSENGTHIGLIAYSNRAVLHLKFNNFTGVDLNQATVTRTVDSLPRDQANTHINLALDLARTELFTEKGGMRESKDIKKVGCTVLHQHKCV